MIPTVETTHHDSKYYAGSVIGCGLAGTIVGSGYALYMGLGADQQSFSENRARAYDDKILEILACRK